jgi:peptidoglycan/LPS O-acetylase OafA/YrhL
MRQEGEFSFPTVAANLTMVPELLGAPQMLGIFWTLETEVISYAVAVLLFMGGLFNRPRVLATVCVALVVIFAFMMFGVLPSARILQWQMLPHNLALILWGSLFHLTYGRWNYIDLASELAASNRQKLITAVIAISVLSPSFYSLLQYVTYGNPDNLRWGVAYPTAFGLFLVAFFGLQRVPRFFVWLGQVSYSAYLLHPFVIAFLLSVLKESRSAEELVGIPLFAFIALIATNAVASLSFYLLEMPAIRLGKKLETKYRQGSVQVLL